MSLGIGVIGAGIMGAEHARIVAEETHGAHLAAVCDADPARAASAARGGQALTDPHALIASDAVKALVIATPDTTHVEYALAALARGKPVLCEKPLAAHAKEGLRVVEAETRLGRRLVQVGFMRRFDPGYGDMRRARLDGRLGAAIALHNVHRNLSAPASFTPPLAVKGSFVHEADISRWLLGTEMVEAQAFLTRPGLMMIVMRTDRGELVSTEVHVNCGYGYHVHAQLVAAKGTIEMAPPARTLTNHAGVQSFGFPDDWVPRFADAYRCQMQAWVNAAAAGGATGASAWDGYVATAICEQIAASLPEGRPVKIALEARPGLYAENG